MSMAIVPPCDPSAPPVPAGRIGPKRSWALERAKPASRWDSRSEHDKSVALYSFVGVFGGTDGGAKSVAMKKIIIDFRLLAESGCVWEIMAQPLP
jgi:hypothetical protein